MEIKQCGTMAGINYVDLSSKNIMNGHLIALQCPLQIAKVRQANPRNFEKENKSFETFANFLQGCYLAFFETVWQD